MDFKGERSKPNFVRGYHASGHASKGGLMRVIEQIDPDVVIPVHTSNPKWFDENFENVRIVEEGESFKIRS